MNPAGKENSFFRASSPGPAPLGLGLDAGGTATRWALVSAGGEMIAQGQAPGMSGLQMGSRAGRQAIGEVLQAIAGAVAAHGRVVALKAGITGLAEDSSALGRLMAQVFDLEAGAVELRNDITFAYLDVFAPGQGYLIYAGTGSIGAFIDAQGHHHRVGGRGVILDDGGSGYWIAKEALRHLWRQEDEAPGLWQKSALGRQVFAAIGGADWGLSRAFIYQRDRGEVGKLAVAVAQAADEGDGTAQEILSAAGRELGRLGALLVHRFGPRPVSFAGRVPQMHPLIGAAARASLPEGISADFRLTQAHWAAAGLAAASLALPQERKQ